MKIPSETELGKMFSASRMTVNRALRELCVSGIIIRKRGKGSYVARPKNLFPLFEVKSIADDIRSRGGSYSCNIHHLGKVKAVPELAESMELEPYDTLFHSIIIHLDDKIPIQLADRYVNPIIAPHYLDQDFTSVTPSDYLQSLSPIDEVEHIVEAQIPETWVRKLLLINESEPCLVLRRTTWSDNHIATKSTFYYPGSRYSLGGRFKPPEAKNPLY